MLLLYSNTVRASFWKDSTIATHLVMRIKDSGGGDDDSEQRPSMYMYSTGENSEVTQWFNDER